MDELKIRTPLMKALIGKMIRSALKRSLGCGIDIMLHDLTITVKDGKAHICVNAEGDIGLNDISRILTKAGRE